MGAGSAAHGPSMSIGLGRLWSEVLVEAAAEVVWLCNDEGQPIEPSPSLERFTGCTYEVWLSLGWDGFVHPDDRPLLREVWAKAAATRKMAQIEFRLSHRDGKWRWVHQRAAPFHDDLGRFVGWAGMCFDIDRSRRTALALRDSEATLRALVEGISVMTWNLDAEGRVLGEAPQRWLDFTGQTKADWDERRWLDVVHPADQERLQTLWWGKPGQSQFRGYEYRLRTAMGSWRWMSERVVPVIPAGHDQPTGFVGITSDIHDAKQNQIALESHERLLRKALKAARISAWTWYFASDQLKFTHVDGFPLSDSVGAVPAHHLVRRLRPVDELKLRQAIAGGEPFEMTCAIENKGNLAWMEISGQSDGESKARGILRDVTAQMLAEERRNLLIGEIAHRGKNLLAVIQAMAGITLDESKPIVEARSVFLQRLAALARSHAQLTQRDWEGVPLDEIVRQELIGHAEQALVSVPSIILNPSSAQNIALVVHELVTNASKHGALSIPNGSVQVDGAVVFAGGSEVLKLTWQERGGPPVAEPSRTGFGSILIRRLVDGFDTQGEIEYRPEELFLQVDMPVAMITPRKDTMAKMAS